MNNKISKFKLISKVQSKLDFKITKRHISCVISILFEEMIKDFIQHKAIKIKNFGTFHCKKTKARMHMSIVSKQMNMSSGRNFLSFELEGKIMKFLKKNLDPCKTFGGD